MHSYMSPLRPRVVYTLGSSRAYVAARANEIRPAHVSANLIYFGPDKKLIYREARPGSLGKRRFSAPSRENRKWRAGLPGSLGTDRVADEIPSCDEVQKKESRKRSRGEEAESKRRNLDWTGCSNLRRKLVYPFIFNVVHARCENSEAAKVTIARELLRKK